MRCLKLKTAGSNHCQTRALTVRVREEFHRRLMSKLFGERMELQSKVQLMLEEYVDGPPVVRPEFARQVELAKGIRREYEPALRERAP